MTPLVVGLLDTVEGVVHKRVTTVSLGEMYGCVVKESGSLYVWGNNVYEFEKVGTVSPSIFLAQRGM